MRENRLAAAAAEWKQATAEKVNPKFRGETNFGGFVYFRDTLLREKSKTKTNRQGAQPAGALWREVPAALQQEVM